VRPLNVRFGSKADMASRPHHVRYSPQSGHSSARVARPLCAMSRHLPALAIRVLRSEANGSSEIARLTRAPTGPSFL
jgi:hypothetical protein